MELINNIGSDVVSTVIAFTIFGIAGYLFYTKYMKGSDEAPKKIKLMKGILLFLGVSEAFIAGFAASEGGHAPLGMRIMMHIGLLGFNTVLTYGIWVEIREAIIAFKDLGKFSTESDTMTFEYGFSIIYNFILEWVQVFVVMAFAIAAILINMYLMGLSTGQLIEIHAAASFIVPYLECPVEYAAILDANGKIIEPAYTFIEIINKMRDDVAGNFFLSCFHVGGVGLLGLLSRDKTATGAASATTSPTYSLSQVLGYYIKHIAPSATGTALNQTTFEALLKVDSANKFANELELERLFVEAKDNKEIASNSGYSMDDRKAANDALQITHAEMVKLVQEIELRATTITGGPSGP